MKVQVRDNRIISEVLDSVTGDDIYEPVGDVLNISADTRFDLRDGKLYITGIKESIGKVITDFQRGVYADYKQAQDRLKAMATEKGIANLTPAEKRISAEWFVLPQLEVTKTLSLKESIAARKRYTAASVASREHRFAELRNYFDTVLNGDDTGKVMNVLVSKNFEYMYCTLGVEGDGNVNFKGKKDTDGLLDFLQSKASYATTGIASLNLVPFYNLAVPDLVTSSVDIIRHGKRF